MSQRSVRESLSEIAGYTAPATVHTDQDVWDQVRDDGVTAVAARMTVTPRQLLDVLTAEALCQADEYRPSWIRRHVLDLLIILGVGFAGVLIWHAQLPLPDICGKWSPNTVWRHLRKFANRIWKCAPLQGGMAPSRRSRTWSEDIRCIL